MGMGITNSSEFAFKGKAGKSKEQAVKGSTASMKSTASIDLTLEGTFRVLQPYTSPYTVCSLLTPYQSKPFFLFMFYVSVKPIEIWQTCPLFFMYPLILS